MPPFPRSSFKPGEGPCEPSKLKLSDVTAHVIRSDCEWYENPLYRGIAWIVLIILIPICAL